MNAIIKQARTIQEKRKGYIYHQGEVKQVELDNWRNVRTLLTDKYFDQMLKEYGMTKEEFSYALIDNNELDLEEDAWYKKFEKIVDACDLGIIDYKETGVNIAAFPFLCHFSREMKKKIAAVKHVKIEDQVLEDFLRAHLLEMFHIFGKVMALDLAEFKMENELKSETKEDRLVEFLQKAFHSKEDMLRFYEKYPVAARVATIRTGYLLTNYTKMIERIDQDHKEVKEFLQIPTLTLTDVGLSSGDSHAKGNSVSILYFGTKKLVYKPKNMDVCMAFEQYMDWCHKKSNLLDIKIPKGIYKKDYCYNEFIYAEYCTSEKAIENFYTRYGELIAICYLLNINDLHLENVVAMGEYPVIIDLETLFQAETQVEDDSVYGDMFRYLETNSIANSLLLPRQINVGSGKDVDLSALNGREVETNSSILIPKNMDTDDFHYEKEKSMFLGGNNIPKIDEENEVDVSKYNMFIYEGFMSFMKFVIRNKKECIDALEVFKGKQIRFLAKSTERYASMIRYADHPNYNREMKYRERLMMNIWAYPYKDKRIVKSEIRDLLFNDIPIFFSIVDSRDIIDSHGEVYPDYHVRSGYELSIGKIENLSETEIHRQKNILLLSLGILNPYLNQKAMKMPLLQEYRKIDHVRQAENLSEELLGMAYKRNNRCTFLNIDCNKNKEWKLVPTDVSVYGGLSGIAVFYLEMYRRCKDEKYYELYKKMIRTAIDQTKNTMFESAFAGWLSPVYPLILQYCYTGEVEDKEYLEFTVKKLKSLKEDDLKRLENTDYISGLAGIVRLLVLTKEVLGDQYVTDGIIQKFVHELKCRIEEPENESLQKEGIAHGISGVMYGLLSAKAADPSYIREKLHAEYELGVQKENEYKWCWGLPGMIQARLAMYRLDPECIDLGELNQLIDQFENNMDGIVSNDTLCHGNGSIITTFRMLYDFTQDEKWLSKMKLWISNMNQRSMLNGYQIMKIGDIVTKGIFDGLYGVAWIYLYVSGQHNNILMLEAN